MIARLARALGAPFVVAADESLVADAAVVLGAPLSRTGGLTDVLAERVAAGVELWRRGKAPLLVMTGGRTRRGLPAEGAAMAEAARRQGVPVSALLVEDAARFTAENARNVAPLLLPSRRRVWVVTQPFHLRRAVLWFERFGFEPLGLYLRDSLQFRNPWRELRWIAREVPAWVRDRFIATRLKP